MKKISCRVGRISSRCGEKISLAASGDPVYPSEALVEALTEIFRNANPNCVQRANDAIAENPNIGREELIDILTEPGCFDDTQSLEDVRAGGNLLSWVIANPVKATALGLGATAATVLGTWLISSLIKRGKVKKTLGEATEKIRRIQQIAGQTGGVQAYTPDPTLALTEEQIREISIRDPAILAVNEFNSVTLNLSNPTSNEYKLVSVDVEVKYYKSLELLKKPYIQNVTNLTIEREDLGSGKPELRPSERRSDTLSLSRLPVYNTDPEYGTIASMRPVFAYFIYQNPNTNNPGTIKLSISFNPAFKTYSVNTLGM